MSGTWKHRHQHKNHVRELIRSKVMCIWSDVSTRATLVLRLVVWQTITTVLQTCLSPPFLKLEKNRKYKKWPEKDTAHFIFEDRASICYGLGVIHENAFQLRFWRWSIAWKKCSCDFFMSTDIKETKFTNEVAIFRRVERKVV